ncbi:RHS repeat-associated core domain-containing protein [Streptomyces sp. NPDC003753]
MTDAWTGTDACAGNPSTTGTAVTVGGPDPYWTTWTFDANGNRKTQVKHAVASQSGDTTTSYTYGQPSDPTKQPDTLTSTQTTLPDTTISSATYAYDASGNATTRSTTPGTDTLTWNDKGKLASLKSTSQTNSTTYTYTYDAESKQLLRTDPDGKTTLFLPGQELTYDPTGTGTTSGARYISLPGGVTCTRTGVGSVYNFVASNDQATGTASLDSTAQTPTFRLFNPYGNPRGTQPNSWPGGKGFVGGTQDKTTNLTHLGAREYDPSLGRFISADPLFEATDPNQIGGFSDPSGLRFCADDACRGDWVDSRGGYHDVDGNDAGSSYCDRHKGYEPSGGSGTGGRTSRTGNSGNVIVFAEVPQLERAPWHYVWQASNGVCVWAAASSCATAESQNSALDSIPDLSCASGESQWVCDARNNLYKFAVISGMTGGSVGFFGLRAGTRWNQTVGLPEGVSRAQFSDNGGVLRKGLKLKADVVVQGSRVTGNVTGASDLDVAVRLTPETFDAMVDERWSNVKPGSAKERTRDRALETGKITAGDSMPKLSGLRSQNQDILGDEVGHVDVSIIKMGEAFDNVPFIGIK